MKRITGFTLHEAIIEILKTHGHPLTVAEITTQINLQGLYIRRNGESAVSTKQVSARINRYPAIFKKDKSSRPMKIII